MVSTPVTYNTGSAISGTLQVGYLAVGITPQDYSSNYGGSKWWNGPDQDLGYIIATSVSGGNQPTPIFGVNASVGFYRSKYLTDESFLSISNYIGGKNGQSPFSTTSQATNWLYNNGYWTSYPETTGSFFLLAQDGTILTAQNGYQIEIQY